MAVPSEMSVLNDVELEPIDEGYRPHMKEMREYESPRRDFQIRRNSIASPAVSPMLAPDHHSSRDVPPVSITSVPSEGGGVMKSFVDKMMMLKGTASAAISSNLSQSASPRKSSYLSRL